MVSDMAQALERDGVFGESADRKKMCVRTPAPDEMVPAVMTEGRNVKEFPQDFFIVNVNHAASTKSEYN